MTVRYATKDEVMRNPEGNAGHICRNFYIPGMEHPVLHVKPLNYREFPLIDIPVDVRVFTFQEFQIPWEMYKTDGYFSKTTVEDASKLLMKNHSLVELVDMGRRFHVVVEAKGLRLFLHTDYAVTTSDRHFKVCPLGDAIKLIEIFREDGVFWHNVTLPLDTTFDKTQFKIIEVGVICDDVTMRDGYEVHFFSGKGQLPLVSV